MRLSDPHIEAQATARLGKTFKGKWHLDELVGYGGVAAVYAATHRNRSRVAVKVLHNELAAIPSLRDRFMEEGYAANAVDHPGVVRVLDDDVSEEGEAFLVMELLTGSTLEEHASRHEGRLPWAQVLTVTDEILDVLAVAHDKNILHRDIKPENVYVTDQGVTKVLDFGLARVREAGVFGSSRTRIGFTMGTPGFMSPEQLRGQWDKVDARSDIWAVGATMYSVLSGQLVYEGASLGTTQSPRLSRVMPEAPAVVAEIVDTALALMPQSRYSTAREMQAAVRAALPQTTPRTRASAGRTTGPHLVDSRRAGGRSPTPPERATCDNVTSIEVAPGTFWVGKRDPQAIFHANPYLLTLERDQNLIIDPGSSSDFAVVSAKVAQRGGLGSLTGMFFNHQDPDVCSSASMISNRYAAHAAIYCSDATWRLIVHQNLPRNRFVDTERYAQGFKIGSRTLIPIPSPFCHFRGATMLYDPETRVLFSGDLFGGLTEPSAKTLWADESDWAGIRAFHQMYMPSNRALAAVVRALRELNLPIEMIAPQHGRVLVGATMESVLERIERLPVGVDLFEDVGDGVDTMMAWSSVLNRVLHTGRMVLDEESVDSVRHHEAFAECVRFQGERAEVTRAGRWTIGTAVHLLTRGRGISQVNPIVFEAVHACEELELPSPEIHLDRPAEELAPASMRA
ncbi:MAG: protein kinase [Polyangiaceae bacterium]